MTEVLLVGADTVREDLLAYENARRALSAVDLSQPYANALRAETVSLGAAVSLLNDLDWYLSRAVDDALVREPSVDAEEYLSRALAEAVRDDRRAPADTDRHLKVYGVEAGDPPRLVEPMFANRVEGTVPAYDLRKVVDTVVVRVDAGERGRA
jgi:hypothetical protein